MNIIKTLKSSISEKGNYCYSLPVETTKLIIKDVEQLQQENNQLKDNWNYIKKMLKEARNEEFNIIGYCGTCTDVDIDFLLNKMQELEKGDSNV